MDFRNAKELLKVCQEQGLSISAVMLQRELTEGEQDPEETDRKMDRVLEIMKSAASTPIHTPVKSMGGLIGGEAKKISDHKDTGKGLCGDLLERAVIYAMATLETNASMGVIVASPTAGSAGIVPGLLLALQETYDLSDEQIKQGLYNASAIGYLAMRNATVAGAVGGCQAEVGSASAMAAAAAVEICGGTPNQAAEAFAMALSNLLGLVCDPVAGLVEIPCVKRNVVGSVNALACADMALAGLTNKIPADEVIGAMKRIGENMPVQLRETGLGGLATTKTGLKMKIRIFGEDMD